MTKQNEIEGGKKKKGNKLAGNKKGGRAPK